MRFFNTIQVTALTMLSPILLTWLYSAKFVGQGAVFWVSVGGTVALALWVGSMIYDGLGRD